MQYTWLPFQSPEIRDIYAHLTPTEKQQLMAQARGYGRESGRRIGAWNGIACGLFAALYSFWRPFSLLWLVPFILVVNFMPYCFKAERQRSRARHQRVRELLAATEYAKGHHETRVHPSRCPTVGRRGPGKVKMFYEPAVKGKESSPES